MCDDVWDVKVGHGLVDGMNGVETWKVFDVVKEYVVIGIGVHVEDVEVVWSDVETVNDVNVGRKLADVVDL